MVDGTGALRRYSLMKYALGLVPNQVCVKPIDGTNTGLLLVVVDTSNLTLTYQRDTSKSDINYLVQATTDLSTWSNTGITE